MWPVCSWIAFRVCSPELVSMRWPSFRMKVPGPYGSPRAWSHKSRAMIAVSATVKEMSHAISARNHFMPACSLQGRGAVPADRATGTPAVRSHAPLRALFVPEGPSLRFRPAKPQGGVGIEGEIGRLASLEADEARRRDHRSVVGAVTGRRQ